MCRDLVNLSTGEQLNETRLADWTGERRLGRNKLVLEPDESRLGWIASGVFY